MDDAAVARIAEAVRVLARDLDALKEAGRNIPSIEKNVSRMQGVLRQLEVQFVVLEAVTFESEPSTEPRRN